MNDQPTEKSTEQIQVEGLRLLGEIEQFRKQAEEQAKAAELCRQKADSEALYAFNAKGACEGHATTIANLKGTAEADANAISTNKQRSDELTSAVTAGKASAEADGRIIADLRRETDLASNQSIDSARKAEERLKEIEESRTTAEAAAKEAKAAQDGAANARERAVAAQTQAEQFAKEAEELISNISAEHTQAAQLKAEIAAAATSAKTDQDNLAEILQHITKSDGIATKHEERAAALNKELEALLEKVEGLLPGATSASLATAFNKQRARFKSSQRKWIWTFVLCIVSLLGVSAPSFYRATFGDVSVFSWEVIFRGLSVRLPIAAPLVWLAIYAGRNYMLSLRLEEDYAYKEAISTAFEGYKREMNLIPAGDGANPTPLATLCGNVIKAIAERPGRIYDGKDQDITILTEMQSAAREGQQLGAKTIARA